MAVTAPDDRPDGGPARLEFVKMQGAGNDYVYLDAVTGPIFDESQASHWARRLADRHFGVGGDGLIVLAPSAVADCRMLMWNADGSRGAMCGNGVRCLAVLARQVGAVDRDDLTVETDGGIRAVRLLRDGSGAAVGARVDMGPVRVAAEPETVSVPGAGPGGATLEIALHRGDAGNPHAVWFAGRPPAEVDLAPVGRALQVHPLFPDGVNLEAVHVDPAGRLLQRTWERGSGETLACGSGATVAALAAVRTGRLPGPRVEVVLIGGSLFIECGDPSALVMEGPAHTVFRGSIALGALA